MSDLSKQLDHIAWSMGFSHGSSPPPQVKREVFDRIKELNKQGLGATEIARVLDKEDVPTPKGGKHWSRDTVSRVVKRNHP